MQVAKEHFMPFELQTAADGIRLILAGRLGVQEVRSLWDALQPALAANLSIRLHAAALDEMDTSIVQVLCRLNRPTGHLQVETVSEGFIAALKARGLAALFLTPSCESNSATPEMRSAPLLPETGLDTLPKAARQGHA
jgi:ABC-type transporter Mla MlaB component